MRFATLFLSALASTQAFSPAFTASRPTTFLQETHIDKDFTADSGMNVESLPLYIDNLDIDNFHVTYEYKVNGKSYQKIQEIVREEEAAQFPEFEVPLQLNPILQPMCRIR